MSLLPKTYQTNLMLALEKILREFESLPVDVIKNFWNPNKCRKDLLPFLAVMLGVTVWSETLSEVQQRKVCREALIINRKKGTVGAIKRALKTLNLNAVIVEWFEDREERDPLTARVVLQENEIIYNDQQYKAIENLVNQIKRLSVHVTFEKRSAFTKEYYTGGALRFTVKTKIGMVA